MACLATSAADESRASSDNASLASRPHRRSKRALFGGSVEGSIAPKHGSQAANGDASELDDASEPGGSESEFTPSDDAVESDASGSEDDMSPAPRVGRKRKRVRSTSEVEDQAATVAASVACTQCGDAFPSTAARDAHSARPHAFVCDIEGCARRFADEARAIRHVHVWHDARANERFVCSTCDTFHLTRHDLQLHSRQSNHATVAVAATAEPRFVCETCHRAYRKRDKLTQHMRRYHERSADGTSFGCPRCEAAGFATRHERVVHMAAAHPGVTSTPQTPCFVCEVVGCGKSYSKREHLTRHVAATHDAPQEKPFGCELCGVRFVYKHALTRHHTNCHTTDVEKPYACSVCLLAFKKKSLLQAHSFVHTGVLPFECEDCSERFAKRFQLVRHARKHAAAKPSQAQVFMCEHDDCGELLFSVNEKREHMQDAHGVTIKEEEQEPAGSKKHGKRGKQSRTVRSEGTAGRELRCLVCNQVFTRIQYLRSHLRTHFEALDDRKLHVCPMDGCLRAYTKKSNLMAHYNAAHDPVKSVRFKCPYDGCDGAFGYKKVLQTHIASIHEKVTSGKKEEGEAAGYSGSDSDDSITEKTKTTKKKKKGHQAMGVLSRVLGLNDNGDQVASIKREPAIDVAGHEETIDPEQGM